MCTHSHMQKLFFPKVVSGTSVMEIVLNIPLECLSCLLHNNINAVHCNLGLVL